MLSREFLIERGHCCGHGCLMCPYEPKHQKGNKTMSNPFWGDEDKEGWYHIRARDMGIYKPNGKVIEFWLWGNSEVHIKELLSIKGVKDIEWIRKEEPPFT